MLFGSRARGFYAGSGSYKHIDPLITGSSKRLLIVSPYISSDYFRLLDSVARRKRVRVITTLNSLKRYEGLGLRSASRSGAKLMAATALLLVAAVGAAYFGRFMISAALAACAVFAAAAFVVRSRIPSSRRLEVRVPLRGFVHEKLYISDNEAVMGSANLTFNGTHRNIEQIERVTEKAKVAQLAEHFDELWASC